MRSASMIVIAAFAASIALAQDAPESWIDSPEAYFATAAEKTEWNALPTRAARDAFKDRYWLRRDPTPGTAANEFRETVLGRIRVADQRFTIDRTPGSLTARGFVFIVFGSPSRADDYLSPRPPAPPRAGENVTRQPWGFNEGNEITSNWTYDRERTPEILQAIGGRPNLTVTFVLEPTRRKDRLQNPGLIMDYRDVIAEKSISNPSLVAGAAPRIPVTATATLPGPELDAAARTALTAARTSEPRPHEQAFGHLVTWDGSFAMTSIWMFVPDRDPNLRLVGSVTDAESGLEVVRISRRAGQDPSFVTSRPGAIATTRVPLPPGSYTGTFALLNARNESVAHGVSAIRVPDVTTGPAISSLIISGGAEPSQSGGEGFSLGGLAVRPRADASFLSSESLWYFFQTANLRDPANATLEVRLRRGSSPMGSPSVVPAGLQEIASGRHVGGYELPLGSLADGEYTIYVTLRDGADSLVRRADFRVVNR